MSNNQVPTDPNQPDDRPPIDWRNSEAKDILVSDLEAGILSLHAQDVSAEEAWITVYGRIGEFKDVPFRQFKARLQDHRGAVQMRFNQSTRDQLAFEHDRLLYPRQTHNHRGEPVFDKSAAQKLLRQDVKNNLHQNVTAKQLQAARPEYAPFDLDIFQHRIYQEERLQKFVYYMETKRAKKELTKKNKKKKSIKKIIKSDSDY